MRTVVNDTTAALPITYCVVINHFGNDGTHRGTLKPTCKVKSHLIEPGSALTFDDEAKNGPTLESLLAPLEV